jgi:hypothetical protein
MCPNAAKVLALLKSAQQRRKLAHHVAPWLATVSDQLILQPDGGGKHGIVLPYPGADPDRQLQCYARPRSTQLLWEYV